MSESGATLKAAVIGAGHIARQHLACLQELPGVEVAAVCDLSPAVAAAAGERFGVDASYQDYRQLLTETQPDVVHVTTPVRSHFPIARDALSSGANVILEKPATADIADLRNLVRQARETKLALIEDYNYVFNHEIQRLLALHENGELGQVTHVEVFLCLDILGEGSPYVDRNSPHPTQSMPGGAIADFLSHLASLAYFFVGRHRAVRTLWSKRASGSPLPADEFRALIDADQGTAQLNFSAHSQPDVFWLRVYGTRMRAEANLFEPRLTLDRVRGGLRPLVPLANGLREARDVRRAAWRGLWRKLSGGPGAYEGLWTLLERSYASIRYGNPPPVTLKDIEQINDLVYQLTCEENKI